MPARAKADPLLGVVEIRPEGNANPEIATGEIEINATSLTVLGEIAPLPFQLDEDNVDEVLRLRYRWLDLRRPRMQHNLRLSHTVVNAIRGTMDELGFVDILVNVAGSSARNVIVETSDDDWDAIIRANVYGPFYSTRALARKLMEAGRGGAVIMRRPACSSSRLGGARRSSNAWPTSTTGRQCACACSG